LKQIILACAIACALQGQEATKNSPYITGHTPMVQSLSPLELERLKRIDAELNVLDLQFQTAWEKARAPKQAERNETLEPKCKAAGIELADCVPDMKTGALSKRQPPPSPAPAKTNERPSDPGAK